jgi:type IV secretion system protein VirB10
MMRHAYVLLLSSAVALAQTQATSQNQTQTQTQEAAQPTAQPAAQPATTNGQQGQTSDRPYYDYDGKPRPAPLAQPAVAGPDAITVPAGTKIPLRLESTISTKSAHPGDGVYLQTTFPVTIDNTVVIPVGTYVQGVITSVKRPGRVSGRAEVLFHFTTMIYPDGYTVSIPGSLNDVPGSENSHVKDKEGTVQADSTKGRDAATIAGPTATGAVTGAIVDGARGAGIGSGIGAAVGIGTVLLTRGNDVRIEQGSTVEMVLQRSLVLNDVSSHTRYYSGPMAGSISDAHRFRVPPRDRQNGDRPVLTPAPER